jgi:hypothetical protein
MCIGSPRTADGWLGAGSGVGWRALSFHSILREWHRASEQNRTGSSCLDAQEDEARSWHGETQGRRCSTLSTRTTSFGGGEWCCRARCQPDLAARDACGCQRDRELFLRTGGSVLKEEPGCGTVFIRSFVSSFLLRWEQKALENLPGPSPAPGTPPKSWIYTWTTECFFARGREPG